LILNPIDAIRTGALLATEGTAAFGPASLAFLRFTHGTTGAGMMLGFSIAAWIITPAIAAFSRLQRCHL
jgi:Cu-processing system permease protein